MMMINFVVVELKGEVKSSRTGVKPTFRTCKKSSNGGQAKKEARKKG
jgi:hypothetical protein